MSAWAFPATSMDDRCSSTGRCGADRSGPPRVPGRKGPACLAWLLAAMATLAAQAPAPPQIDAQSKRAAERLAALHREAETLAKQERTLLGELRKREVYREIRIETLTALVREAADVRGKLGSTTVRAKALETEAERQRPDIEGRLVRLYKMGRAGYWRMLLDVKRLRDVGRACRHAAAPGRVAPD